MAESSFIHSETSNAPQEIETTIPVGEGFLHITTTRDLLVEDVMKQAQDQKIDPDEIEQMARHLSFSFTPKLEEKISGLVGSVSTPKGSKHFHVMLNAEGIGKIVSNPTIFDQLGWSSGIKFPSIMNQEAKLQALPSLINAIWKHESWHVIEEMDDTLRMGKQMKSAKILHTGASLIMMVGATTFLPHISQIVHQPQDALFILGTSLGAAGYAVMWGNSVYHAKFTPSEIKAYQIGREEFLRPSIKSPFLFEFESN